MELKPHLAILLLFIATTVSADPDKQTYKSGQQQVALLELYTSQGCSSCPPADRWMSNLKSSRRLWKDFVPITFHVGYWNYIGWNDKYAHKRSDQRQLSYHRQGSVDSVYTPGFVLNGKEWRGFFLQATEPPKPAERDVGNLVLQVENDTFTAQFNTGNQRLHIAVLAMGLNTQVKRGENRGRTLSHDFVVVGYQLYNPSEGRWSGKLPTITHSAKEYAIAAWVSDEESQIPIQAVGGVYKP